jgi:hypothetical protein
VLDTLLFPLEEAKPVMGDHCSSSAIWSVVGRRRDARVVRLRGKDCDQPLSPPPDTPGAAGYLEKQPLDADTRKERYILTEKGLDLSLV